MFDLHSPEWTPASIEALDDVLFEFLDVFPSSKTDLAPTLGCSSKFWYRRAARLSPTSRSHRINPILVEEVDNTLNQYLAAGLIQHSTSPYSSPPVVVPKQSGGVRTLRAIGVCVLQMVFIKNMPSKAMGLLIVFLKASGWLTCTASQVRSLIKCRPHSYRT